MSSISYNRIVGVGSCIPSDSVSNQELVSRLAKLGVETSNEWITERTGIRQRFYVTQNETTTSLATQSSLKALKKANKQAQDIDLIIVATSTPDQIFPSVACMVQSELGAHQAVAFDIQAVCAGFVYALSVADSLLKTGQYRCALVIGSECFSRIMDWQDRSTCVLFGDGAGAVVLEAGHSTGILTTALAADGTQSKTLETPGRIESGKVVGSPFLRMDGQSVFKFAVSSLAKIAEQTLQKSQLNTTDIDWVVPHQANIRIMQSLAKKLCLDESKMVSTVAQFANTSAASIPMALDMAVTNQQIQPNQLLLFLGIGGGFTWGSALLRF
jgi:3-oxoacyl-[acyl-carrier-protein] synthase-3